MYRLCFVNLYQFVKPMIELKNVTKVYPNGTKALSGLDLTIENGEFVFIVGESGAGKSTLLKLLLREEEVTSGAITVDGCELASLKKKEIPFYRRKLGVVFQDFRLFPNKTVYENVAFALRVIGERSATVKLKVGAALKIVDLAEKAKCYPDQLSGEEQQRVALARALANGPGIIIADEPTGNIDPRHSYEIMEMLIRIQRRYQKTVIVVTHESALVDLFHERVVTIRDGRVAEDRAGEVYTDLSEVGEEAESEAVGDADEVLESSGEQSLDTQPSESGNLSDLDEEQDFQTAQQVIQQELNS